MLLIPGKKEALSADTAVEFIYGDLCGVHKLPSFKFLTSVFTREETLCAQKNVCHEKEARKGFGNVCNFHNVTKVSYQNQCTVCEDNIVSSSV